MAARMQGADTADEGLAEPSTVNADTASAVSSGQTSFFDLPPEIRNAIYHLILEQHFGPIHLTTYKPAREKEHQLVQHIAHDPRWWRLTSHYHELQWARSPADSLAITRVNKLIAAETLPLLYRRSVHFETVGTLNLFFTTIGKNAKYLRDISLVGRFPYEDLRAKLGFTQLLAASNLRRIQVPHVMLCGDRKGPRLSIGRTSVSNFVRDIKPVLLQLRKTVEDGESGVGVLDVVKVFKVELCASECPIGAASSTCNEFDHSGAQCGTAEMDTLFQEVSSKLRASNANALGIRKV